MYKLLLVSDQAEVLEAYDQIHNWEYNGFKRPHVRPDLTGARESLQKHHADAVILAVSPEEEKEIIDFLQQEYPLLPITEAGKTPSEALEYLNELKQLLNRIRADFSSDVYDERKMMLRARRNFFRTLVVRRDMTRQEVYRRMRMLRSRMDPDRPCILMELEQFSADEDRLVGKLQDTEHLLERELYQSFGGDVNGFHVLPLVSADGKVYVLAGALKDQEQSDDMIAVLNECIKDGISHAEEYRGLHLRVTGIQVLPSLYAFCADYVG